MKQQPLKLGVIAII